ncbi:MAG: LacI family transcriptional regulator [Chloroflexi bacterium]|nr:LacI family transcriptional regulator [Chloroflexota bacterium]
MATLTEVAKRAGVSIATVSKVLSNTPYFTEETRQKVMQAVEELGYVPNLAARALSSGKTFIIAVVFPYVYDTISSDPLMQHILVGIETECSERGYNLLLSTPRLTAEGPDENYQRLIRSGYLEGIVALDNVPISSVLPITRQFNVPAVSIGYGEHDVYIRSDDYGGGHSVMEHIIALGHRYIGIVTVPCELHLSVQQRLQGMTDCAGNAGVEVTAQVDGDFSIRSGAKMMAHLLEAHPELTAVVCINDRMAFGAIQEAHRRGMRVPDDITVCGYDDIPLSALIAPPLTTVSQHAPELGQTATEMLFAMLDGKIPDPVLMPTELMVRQSSAPPASII